MRKRTAFLSQELAKRRKRKAPWNQICGSKYLRGQFKKYFCLVKTQHSHVWEQPSWLLSDLSVAFPDIKQSLKILFLLYRAWLQFNGDSRGCTAARGLFILHGEHKTRHQTNTWSRQTRVLEQESNPCLGRRWWGSQTAACKCHMQEDIWQSRSPSGGAGSTHPLTAPSLAKLTYNYQALQAQLCFFLLSSCVSRVSLLYVFLPWPSDTAGPEPCSESVSLQLDQGTVWSVFSSEILFQQLPTEQTRCFTKGTLVHSASVLEVGKPPFFTQYKDPPPLSGKTKNHTNCWCSICLSSHKF